MASALTRDEMSLKIKSILIDRFGLDAQQLMENARLRDLGVDSMHIVEVMLDLEDEVGMKLEGLAMPPNPTLANVVDTLIGNIGSATPHAKQA